jgi:hypothetical protein
MKFRCQLHATAGSGVPLDISRENQVDKQQKKKDDSHLHA